MFKKRNKELIKNDPKNIVIVGAGISGLMAGIHALNKNYSVTILEKNSTPGGKLNILDQKYFNYFPKYINGITEFNYLLKEININKTLHPLKNLPVLNSNNDNIYVVKNDLKEFTYFLNYNSKGDEDNIKELISIINNCKNFKKEYKEPYELSSIIDKTKVKASEFLAFTVFKKYGEMTIEEYLDTFSSPIIKEVLGSVMIRNQSVINLFLLLSSFFNHNLGILNFDLVSELTNKFNSLGGKILFNKDCQNLVFEKENEARFIKVREKEEIKSDYFILATDPYFSFTNLLEKKYNDRKFFLRYENYKTYPVDNKLVLVFNINKEFKYDSFIIQDDNLKIGINYVKYLRFYKPINDSKIIYCVINQNYNDYDYIKTLNSKNGLKKYYKEVITEVKKTFKENIKGYDIDILDIFSPINIEESFNTYMGALTGFINGKGQYDITSTGIIPGVKNVLLASSWLNSSGGVLNAMITGKFSINRLEQVIKNEKK